MDYIPTGKQSLFEIRAKRARGRIMRFVEAVLAGGIGTLALSWLIYRSYVIATSIPYGVQPILGSMIGGFAFVILFTVVMWNH